MTCLDYSTGLLSVLRSKLDADGLNAKVVEADARSFDLGREFALVIVPFNAMMEVIDTEDQARVLHNIHRHLRPGGSCICTAHNPVVRARRLTGETEFLGPFPLAGTNRSLTVACHYDLDPQTGIVQGQQVYEGTAQDGQSHRLVELPMRFRLLEREPFEALTVRTGFEIVHLYGDYNRTRFDHRDSPFMIWRLRRR